MAVYPEGNPGAYPLDPTSEVGKFRLMYGDTVSEPYDPVQVGFQNYGELSDAEIENYLASGGGSLARAIGYYYLALAGQAAKESVSVKDYDLQIDLSKRADQLSKIADQWLSRADEEDGLAGLNEYFDIVETGQGGQFIPEGTIPMYGRRYTWERYR